MREWARGIVRDGTGGSDRPIEVDVAEFILETVKAPSMADMDWDDSLHKYGEAFAGGCSVVMLDSLWPETSIKCLTVGTYETSYIRSEDLFPTGRKLVWQLA